MTLGACVHRFLEADDGASSVEYGLLLAGITIAIFATVIGLGQTVRDQLYAKALLLFP